MNRRYPRYPDDADYQTNSPSYYEDLGRKQKLIQLLAEKIWGYDEELKKRFEEWDKNLEEFPEEIKKLLEKWLDDGTIVEIIDKEIFKTFNTRGVDVRLFGVKGDGVTNDTDKLNNALLFLKDFNYSNLFFPNGEYLLDKIHYDDHLNIIGESKEKTLLMFNRGEENFIQINSDRFNKKNLSLKNVTIDGLKEFDRYEDRTVLFESGHLNVDNCLFKNTTNAAIRFKCDTVKIESCDFKDMQHHSGTENDTTKAIYGEADLIYINNCTFYENIPCDEGKGPGGILLSGENNSLTITNCYFHNIGQNHSENYIGCIDLYTNSNETIISNNKFHNYTYTAIKMQNASYLICSNNIVDGNTELASNAILYQPNVRNHQQPEDTVIISENIVKNIDKTAYYIQGQSELLTKNIMFSNNIAKNVDTGLILRYLDKNISISDFMVDKTTNNGIFIYQCDNSKIKINNVSLINIGANGISANDGGNNLKITCSDVDVSAILYGGTFTDIDSVSIDSSFFNGDINGLRVLRTNDVSVINTKSNSVDFIDNENSNLYGNSWQPKIFYRRAYPTKGQWNKGDRVFNTDFTVSEDIGWACVESGVPGIWKSLGVLNDV